MTLENLEPHYRMVPRERLTLPPRNPIHVVLDNIRSAYNTGSIFRTSDGGAVAHLYLCGMTAYPPNVKLAKTALGAFDYVPWSYHSKTEDALEQLRASHIPIVAVETTPTAISIYDFPWNQPTAIVFGNEVTGILPEIWQQCDGCVKIPMRGFKNSMNVATAFGIVLYEILRSWGIFTANHNFEFR